MDKWQDSSSDLNAPNNWNQIFHSLEGKYPLVKDTPTLKSVKEFWIFMNERERINYVYFQVKYYVYLSSL